MMRLENHWPCVLWLEAMCYFKIVVFGISYYAFLLSIQLYIYEILCDYKFYVF